MRSNIFADRVVGKNNRFTVTVDKGVFGEAVRILDDNGLPRHEFTTLGQVFKKEGLIASPVQERAQMIFALSQELSQTISDIDGVMTARVHLVLPENDPLRQQLIPSSASVFVRHRTTAAVNALVPQIKQLVAYGVSGLSYDKVSVILVPVEAADKSATSPQLASFMGMWIHPQSAARAAWLFYGLLLVIAALGGALGWLVWSQRHRVYTLGSDAWAK
jgi:type III secretion protein J